MSPTTRHVPMGTGPITSPHMIATSSATTVPAATNPTRRFEVGSVLNRLLPEFGIVERALHRRREVVHQYAQAWSPTRGDVIVETDHLTILYRGDRGEPRP